MTDTATPAPDPYLAFTRTWSPAALGATAPPPVPAPAPEPPARVVAAVRVSLAGGRVVAFPDDEAAALFFLSRLCPDTLNRIKLADAPTCQRRYVAEYIDQRYQDGGTR